jgi:drug/metabolite transporter (DMT)-like permease
MPAFFKTTFGRVLLLLLGVMCGSSAVILIRASTEQPMLVASYRLLIASVVLLPFLLRDLKKNPGVYGWKQLGWAVLPALALAAHFISWVIGARMTHVANASVIVNLTPVSMPFFVWMFYREKVNRHEIIGSLFVLAGLVVMSWANIQMSKTYFMGDMICFGSMLAFSAYMALGRKNGGRISIWMYLVPLYFIAGVICLLCALPFINPIKTYTVNNLLLMLGLGIIPTVIGHSSLNYALKYFRGQVVSVANLVQPIFAGLLGYLLFSEQPRPIFYAAAALIVAGVLIVLFSHRSHPA